MFNRLFKNDWPIQLMAIFPLWAYTCFQILFFDYIKVPNYEMSHLYNFISLSLNDFPIVSKLLVFFLIVFQSIFISITLQNHELIDKKSFAPSFIFILFCLAYPQYLAFSPIHFANTFLILFLNKTLITFDEEKAGNSLFTCALYTSLSILFFFPTIVFILPLWISLIVFSNFSFKTLIATLLGIVFPYLYIFSFYYLTDTISNVLNFYGGFLNKSLSIELSSSLFYKIFLGLTSLILLLFSIKLILNSIEKLIRIRKKIQFIHFFSLFSLVAILLSSSKSIHQIGLIFIPSAIIYGITIEEIKNPIFVEVFFCLFVISCIALNVYFL